VQRNDDDMKHKWRQLTTKGSTRYVSTVVSRNPNGKQTAYSCFGAELQVT